MQRMENGGVDMAYEKLLTLDLSAPDAARAFARAMEGWMDSNYMETLIAHGIGGRTAWHAPVETLPLEALRALMTFMLRADHFSEGALQEAIENGFAARCIERLRQLV